MKKSVNSKDLKFKAWKTWAILLGIAIIAVGAGIGAERVIAANSITLYTGGGVVRSNGWNKSSEGVYTSLTATKLPSRADMSDSCTTFAGWYDNASYSGDPVTTPEDGHAYYAKYIRSNVTQTGSTMAYNYTNYTLNGYQLSSNSNIRTSFANYGTQVYYTTGASNPSGGGTYLKVSTSGDPYVNISGTNVYVASVASFYGQYVKYTYYIWNKGGSTYYNFNLGTATDVQIASNDRATVKNTSDSNGRYIAMQDSGRELRMYYTGNLVTNVSTLWIGKYGNNYRGHIFDNARSSISGVDSAYDYSWKNITIPANGVVKKEVLLGCGQIGSMTIKFNYQVDTNGNGIIDSGDSVKTTVNENTSVTLPACTGSKAGYEFAGYNTEADGTGYAYSAGSTLKVQEDTYLYATWTPIKNTCKIELKLDGSNWHGQTVALYKDGALKYELSNASGGTYTSDQVYNGTYEIYVNGLDSRQSITFDSASAVMKTVDLPYDEYVVTTTLDGTNSKTPGYVELYNSTTGELYIGSENDKKTSLCVPQDSVTYKLKVGNQDTGFTMSASNKTVTVPYYTAEVDLTYDTDWTSATVELKQSGITVYTLNPGSSGIFSHMVPYTKMLQGDHSGSQDTYDVYVNSEKIGSVSLTADGLTNSKTSVAATFYKATVNVKCDGKASGGSTLILKERGKTAYQFREDTAKAGTYYVEYVRKDSADHYDIYLDGADIGSDIDSSNATVTLNYYTVTFMSFNDASASVYSTQTVLSGKTPSNISGPYVAGKTFLYWTKDTAGSNPFNFTTSGGTAKDTITTATTLYPQFATPQVSINTYSVCSISGKNTTANTCTGYSTSGTGAYYMPSFSITGFPTTTKAVKYITFDISNGNLYTISQSGVTVDYYNNDAANTASVKITFSGQMTAAEAETYVRTHVFFEPKNTSNGTIQAHVNGTTVQ